MFSYLRRYKECMYLHLGQSSEFNSAQLPSFLHCPPFFGCWEARTPKAQSKIFVVCCSADVGDHRWCGKDGGQEIGKAWLMPAMDAMMTKPNPGCWKVNPCHWLTMTQSLDRSVNEKQIFDTLNAPLYLDMMMLMLLGLISHQWIGLAIIGLYWFWFFGKDQ